MKKVVLLATALSFSASVASAGGPVIIEDDAPVAVIQEQPRSGAWLPLLIGALVIGAAVAGSDS